jgi:hypothetical protein
MPKINRDPSLDADLADELIGRLNELIENRAARQAVETLIGAHLAVPQVLANHPTIQVDTDAGAGIIVRAGFLGLLNGLVGTIQEGPRSGWGYVAAYYDEHRLVRFIRTDPQDDDQATEIA